jgi:hypothetical protein
MYSQLDFQTGRNRSPLGTESRLKQRLRHYKERAA